MAVNWRYLQQFSRAWQLSIWADGVRMDGDNHA
jgi:hypothetical protein